MEFNGTENIAAPRETVWRFATDPESVAGCTPGVESVRILEPGKRFEVVGGVKLGAVGLKAKTVMEFVELVEPERARMTMRGRGANAVIDGSSEFSLRDDGAGTALDWKGTVRVGGPLAVLASRMLKPVTERVLRAFFAAMKAKIEAASGGSA